MAEITQQVHIAETRLKSKRSVSRVYEQICPTLVSLQTAKVTILGQSLQSEGLIPWRGCKLVHWGVRRKYDPAICAYPYCF